MVPVTRQTWTAITSAAMFLVLVATVAFAPIPFVTWTPGSTVDVFGADDGTDRLAIEGVETYPTTGELRMTTVSRTRADAWLGLPEAMLAFWLPSRDVLPREYVYPPGQTAEQAEQQAQLQMDTSKEDATVAAFLAAGMDLQRLPRVRSVTVAGPADGRLQPGDLIESVDNQPVSSAEQVIELVQSRAVGDTVLFEVRRPSQNNGLIEVPVPTGAANDDPRRPVVGVSVDIGYLRPGRVNFGIDPRIGGPSAGLIFSLGIYDRITPGELIDRRIVAGTGTISDGGQVGPIGGIQEKIAGAEEAGATVFLVPAANCADVAGVETDMELVRVGSLLDAIRALEALKDPNRISEVPRCE
ncbi:protease [Parenemella sanctibonifatiensis]|uniref:endopeptidase La n=1 Tax=Parenemella sanctibonifatiensis TaxID=2016505 RepID=A0A255EB59_9ACTN|nr:protease [Parenemella sanctibonifatiensis]